MNPAKITIEGNYWDCQIYRGRMYLFTITGSIKTIDWNALIESIQNDPYLDIVLSYAFQNGRNLYHPELSELFLDKDIRELLKTKFERTSQRQFVVSEQDLDKYLIGEQSSPFKELHTDSEVFSNRLFALTHNSLLSSSIHGGTKYPVSSRLNKHFDLYGFTIRANQYARIAVSAGDDGLMEYNSSPRFSWRSYDDKRMTQISKKHSSFADYSFLSIYSSSLARDSFMSYFVWDRDNEAEPIKINKGEYNEASIFENNDITQHYLSWGSNEKIYRAAEGGLEVVRFNNYAKLNEPIFSKPKFIPLQSWKGRILSASVAYFGTVLHCENAVVVILSDGTIYNIHGEILRVRIFPRSFNYENHLHVIHENCLEVYSFNNDYFVDQKAKDFGFAYRPQKSYRYSRSSNSKKLESDEDYYDFKDEESTSSNNSQHTPPFDLNDLPF